MELFTEAGLRRIERKHAAGIHSEEIIGLLQAKEERFSEATLRKYVQLGLLPMSRRVGIRGKKRGSSGLYPVAIVRLINEIKRALQTGSKLDEIKLGPVALASEVQVLQRAAERLIERLNEAIGHQERKRRAPLRAALDKHRQALSRRVRDLEKAYGRERPKRMPADLKAALERNNRANANFGAFAPSAKQTYITWVLAAKRDETRKKRICEVVRRAVQNKRPGMQ